jgi:hypothetical protein
VSEKIGPFKMRARAGKRRDTDCADTETLWRIGEALSYQHHQRNAPGDLAIRCPRYFLKRHRSSVGRVALSGLFGKLR